MAARHANHDGMISSSEIAQPATTAVLIGYSMQTTVMNFDLLFVHRGSSRDFQLYR